jgi:hypothetical protein
MSYNGQTNCLPNFGWLNDFFFQITIICKVVYIFLNDYFYILTIVQTYGKIMMNTKIQHQMTIIYLYKSIQFRQDMYRPSYKYTY